LFGLEWNGSALVAVVALAVALASLLYAKKSYALAKTQEERREARVDPYLDKSAIWESPDKSSMWLGTLFTIENQSDRDGSISRAELIISYQSESGAPTTLRVHHSPSVTADDAKGFIEVPERLLANGTIKGWLTFKIPMAFYSGRSIEGMHVEFRDPRGVTVKSGDISIPRQEISDPTQT
jgi:hypothetical protein